MEMRSAAWVEELADLDTETEMGDHHEYTVVDSDEEDTTHGNRD
jgi:hypothetical protein